MGLEIEVGLTDRFRIDCALFNVPTSLIRQGVQHLEKDPVLGVQRPDSPMLWDWDYGSFRITYAISADFSKLFLLRLAPYEAPKPNVAEATWNIVRKVNELKRLVGL